MPRAAKRALAEQQAGTEVAGADGAGLAALARLDDKSLRQLWRRFLGTKMPAGVGRSLVLRILAYQQQAQRHGDLDRGSREALAQALVGHGSEREQSDDAASGQLPRVVQPRPVSLRAGTMLGREYAGTMHRVMVVDDGFSWNGKSYDSLSQIAFSITGTKWNGPRFFGLRDKPQSRAGAIAAVSGTATPQRAGWSGVARGSIARASGGEAARRRSSQRVAASLNS